MNIFVDTSVWSLALRRDRPPALPEVAFLVRALREGGAIFTTGLILQELLQGVLGPRDRKGIIERFAALPSIDPDPEDHVAAADLHLLCRRRGIQVTTIDVLLAQLCLRHGFSMLTTDRDFEAIARHSRLSLVRP